MKLAVYVKGPESFSIKGDVTPTVAYDLMIGEANFPNPVVNMAMQRAFSNLDVKDRTFIEDEMEYSDAVGVVCLVVFGGICTLKVCDTADVFKTTCTKAEVIMEGGAWV